MPRLFVPKSHQGAIRDLLELNEQEFSSLVSALKDLPEVTGERLRLSNVSVELVDAKKSEEILGTVEMLYRIWSSRGNQVLDAFIDDLTNAISDFYAQGSTDEARARLRTVLDIEPLARSSKALSVGTDHQRTFYDAKVLSDIRFVFRPDVDAEPFGAAIVHVLRIVYHEDDDYRNFYVALDNEDLALLKSVIDRAEKKTEKLRKRLDGASVQSLGKNGR